MEYKGITDIVTTVAFTPDQESVVVTSLDGKIKV